PLHLYLDPSDNAWQRAVAWRILFEHGFRYTDRTLEIRMTPGESFSVQKLGVAPKDWVSILDAPESWARCLARRKHQVVVACASTLHALAEAVETQGLEIRPPRIVVSDSEVLTAATSRWVERALGTVPVDVFGLAEVSNFAWQCEERQGFHISADSHIVEVAAPPGDLGEVVVTALGMWGMPIIRYETGDLAKQVPGPCRCGRTLPLLTQLSGRVTDAVALPDGSRLYWPYFHQILGAHRDLEQWQVIQEQAGRACVHLVLRGEQGDLMDRIRAELQAALPAGFGLDVVRCHGIRKEPSGKTRVIVSRCTDAVTAP
ncbi:MAG TPA: hypothetical protein VK997_04950, partial [Deferrisomatales bacterium]|nr:hypothetical protein [Deferrisomatales bacterium]